MHKNAFEVLGETTFESVKFDSVCSQSEIGDKDGLSYNR